MGASPRTDRVRLIVIVALLVAGGAWFWSSAVRRNVFPKNFGVVDEGRVYRSGQMTPASMSRIIERHKIKTIIDLGSYWDGPSLSHPKGERRNQQVAMSMNGVTRYVMPLYGDSTGNPNWYIHAVRIMNDPDQQPVLVHCGAGSERTSLATILYRQINDGISDEEGIAEATNFKHSPRRNPHLTEMLKEFGPAIRDRIRNGGQLDDPRFPVIPAPEPVTNPDGGSEHVNAAPGR
jgi:hypothetical protein